MTPVPASIGVALVPPAQRGYALALVFGGLTLAQVLGVPLGSWLAYRVGWRSTFILVAALCLAVALVLIRYVPRAIAAPQISLATPRLVAAAAFTALFIGGLFVVYTFLAPMLEARFGLSADGVFLMLLVFGLGAVAGNLLGGTMTDRLGPRRTPIALCVAQLAMLPAVTPVPASVLGIGALIGMWSVVSGAFLAPQQARLAQLDPPRTPVLFALNAAAIYLGASIGSTVGSFLLKQAGYAAPGPVAAALVALAPASLADRLEAGAVRQP